MKRFWSRVSVEPDGDGWRVALDGRPVKTQGGLPQRVRSRALAEAMADEWRVQGETIDPRGFPMRDLVDFAIDRIAGGEDDVVGKTLAFGETDTLCYRAPPGEALARRQDEEWEPLLGEFEREHGIAMQRVAGVIHKPQAEATMARLRARLEALDPFELAGVHTLSSLAASLCIGLSALDDAADADRLWLAANLEEDLQAEMWGRDEEAEQVREARRRSFLDAYRFLLLLRS